MGIHLHKKPVKTTNQELDKIYPDRDMKDSKVALGREIIYAF